MKRGTKVDTNYDLISTVVKKVLAEMIEDRNFQTEGPTGIYETVDQAVENAVAAQKKLLEMPLKHRDKIIAAIRQAALDHNEDDIRHGGKRIRSGPL